MAHTITHADGTILPDVISNYRANRPSRNVEHDLLGSTASDYTLQPAGLRKGSMDLVFTDEETAAEARDILSLAQVFTFATDKMTTADMDFIITGQGPAFSRGNAGEWIIAVEFSEVPT